MKAEVQIDIGRTEVKSRPLWFVLICIAAAAQFCLTASLSLTRLYTGKASMFDLGVFSQALWTAYKYWMPTVTIVEPHLLRNWLGFHFSPIVLFLTPIYGLFP